MDQLFLERHFDEAIRLIHNRLTEYRDLPDIERLFNPFFLVLAQQYAGDIVGARATAQQMLGPLETLCQKDPDNPHFADVLSVTRAVLGQKDAAIKEAERAITLLPSGKDAVAGPKGEEILASVEVLVGDKNRAIPRLQRLLEIPYADCLTPALLRLHPHLGSFAWRPGVFRNFARRRTPVNARRTIFAELKRRNVYKVGIAYAVIAWLLMQVATQVFPFLEIPNWAIRLVIMLLITRISRSIDSCLGVRADARRHQTNGIGQSRGSETISKQSLDLHHHRSGCAFGKLVFCWPLHSSKNHEKF